MDAVESAFASRVADCDGTWPSAPTSMSYSSLSEIEECPRRWMLRWAHYAAIWDRDGYPDRPTLAALVGDVLHHSVERIVRELAERGCHAADSECAVAVMRELGGYTELLKSVIKERLDDLLQNPRARDRLPWLTEALSERIPDIRQRLQSTIARTGLQGGDRGAGASIAVSQERLPLGPGSHAEVDLRDPDLGWAGRADLITLNADSCEIVDFKTGVHSPTHADQIRIYALLWFSDKQRNPAALPATRLVIRYSAEDVVIHAPSVADLSAMRISLVERTHSAQAQLQRRPPEARPAVDVCQWCPVRHLCEEYWAFIGDPYGPEGSSPESFADVELKVGTRSGGKSWTATISPETVPPRQVILWMPSEAYSFGRGQLVRILNAAIAARDDEELPAVTMTPNSESFLLTDGQALT